METAAAVVDTGELLNSQLDRVVLVRTPEGTILMPLPGFEFMMDGQRYRVNSVANWEAATREMTDEEKRLLEEETTFYLGSTEYFYEVLASNIDQPTIREHDDFIMPNSVYLSWRDMQEILNNRWWRTRN